MEFRSSPTAGSGVTFPGGGSAVWSVAKKTADETRTSTTLSSDASLKFAMTANQKYGIRLRAIFEIAATGDMKFRHIGPASPTAVRICRQHIIAAGTAWVIAMDSAYSSADVSVLNTVAGVGVVFLDGVVQNGANIGDFAFQWSQAAADATGCILRAGSYLEYALM